MAQTSTYDFVAEDSGPIIELQAKKWYDASVIDITGYTVTLKFILNDGDLQSRTATITDAANGKAQYRFAAGELGEGGNLRVEWMLTDGSGYLYTSNDSFTYKVRSRLSDGS